jgi:hypothetical protein
VKNGGQRIHLAQRFDNFLATQILIATPITQWQLKNQTLLTARS